MRILFGHRGRAARTFTLCLLALAATLVQSREARAQWSQPDASGNVTNTNTGAVGIGGAPVKGSKLEVRADHGVAAGEHGLIYASRSGVGTGGVFFGYRANGTAATGGYMRSISNLPLFVGTTATPEAMTIGDNGNVGIGTTNPTRLLELSASSANTQVFMASTAALSIFNTNTTANNTADLSFRTVDSAGAGITPAKVVAVFTNRTPGASAGDLTFVTLNASIGAERMRVTSTGNVGIGTTAPASKLHVAGNITVDGNINAKYQDVAEWVPSTQKLQAGTVVILDAERDNHVLASKGSYDTRVAGVISAQPGLSLGEAGEGKVLVATTGRVKVKVDASRSAIKIGDLIVTSEVEGVAMKSEPISVGGVAIHRPGTLIGKALESLEKGTGEILVLLSLQ